MTNLQAARLRPGDRVRRKPPEDDGMILIVERVETAPKRGGDVTVHAGDRAYMSWEIARVDPLQGWPKKWPAGVVNHAAREGVLRAGTGAVRDEDASEPPER